MSEVEKICERLLNDAQKVEPDVATGCILCGTLSKFSDKFFEVDPPIVPRGDEGVVCWRTQLRDATGSIIVRVWNKACFSLFGITVDKMREDWGDGHECRECEDWGDGHECHERRADVMGMSVMSVEPTSPLSSISSLDSKSCATVLSTCGSTISRL